MLLHVPQTLPFGADAQGTLLVLATAAEPKGYAVWYLTAVEGPGMSRLIRLRDTATFRCVPSSAWATVAISTSSCSTAPVVPRRLAVRSSKAAVCGAAQAARRSAWRARAAYWTMYATPRPSVRLKPRLEIGATLLLPGELPAAFLTLPSTFVDLTRRERVDRVRAGSRWLELNDAANGFLDIRSDAGLPRYRLALFRRNDKVVVVALQRSQVQGQRT